MVLDECDVDDTSELRVRVDIIVQPRIEYVGKPQSCMVQNVLRAL